LNGERERNGKRITGEERATERNEREENLTGASIYLSLSLYLSLFLTQTHLASENVCEEHRNGIFS